MKLKKVLKGGILLALLLASTVLIGCNQEEAPTVEEVVEENLAASETA